MHFDKVSFGLMVSPCSFDVQFERLATLTKFSQEKFAPTLTIFLLPQKSTLTS